MSRGATLSILGLYNADDTIFDLMQFPSKFTETQKDIVKNNILVEAAELEVLYPNPVVMKNIIGLWSAKENPYWERVYNASLEEYNPIENYRRTETEQIADDRKETHSGNDVSRSSGTDATTKTGTDVSQASGSDGQTGNSTVTETNSGTDTTDNNITGYDSNTLVPHDSSSLTHGHVVTTGSNGSNTTNYGRKDELTHNTTDSTKYGKTDTLEHGENINHEGNTDRTLLAYGNIGVTTSQEMLTAEMEVAKIIQVVPIIIESFIHRFCLMVY